MERSLKIVVAGFIVGFPMGGQVWVMLHYMQAMSRMGHEVLFLEDTSDWSYPFDPDQGYGTDSSFGRGVLEDIFKRFKINGQWAYNSAIENRLYGGLTRKELDDYCAKADLWFNISGVNPLRDNYMRCKKKLVIDTDPVFTQARIAEDEAMKDYYTAHDACFTYGYNLPEGKSKLPLSGIRWFPTVPPVIMEEWEPVPSPGSCYTTLGSWNTKGRDIVLEGETFRWSKKARYEALIELPRRVPQVDLELVFSSMGDDERRFAEHGWKIDDALKVSRDIYVYRDYIRNSRAEFTVAKDQNIRLQSGWFSDRSTCFMAAGRPVITEDTGFGAYLPTGEGLFAFESMDDAVKAIEAVEADPERHRKAAQRIAENYFKAEKVVGDMLSVLDLA